MTARAGLALLAGAALLSGCTTTVSGTATAAPGQADPSAGVQMYDYAPGQQHVTGSVDYDESPPVGGPHDGAWADCTGTVYDVEIRSENAVHSLEHGAVWLTYDPDAVPDDAIAVLGELVEGVPHRMMSPYEGQDAPISIQSWNHQLKVDAADDPRLEEFADTFTQDPDNTPELGATCQNSAFLADPDTA